MVCLGECGCYVGRPLMNRKEGCSSFNVYDPRFILYDANLIVQS